LTALEQGLDFSLVEGTGVIEARLIYSRLLRPNIERLIETLKSQRRHQVIVQGVISPEPHGCPLKREDPVLKPETLEVHLFRWIFNGAATRI
jgi:hypothetical protein